MNLVLSFVHFRKEPKTVGPLEAVRLDGEALYDARSGKVLARHREHQWEVEGQRYFRLDASTPVRIHFERVAQQGPLPSRSREFGPFERFSSVDGIAYTDERVFAFVDARIGDWFCYDDGRHWSVMVVRDAGNRSFGNLLASLAGMAPLLPGVLALWQSARLLYLGGARTARSRPAERRGFSAAAPQPAAGGPSRPPPRSAPGRSTGTARRSPLPTRCPR